MPPVTTQPDLARRVLDWAADGGKGPFPSAAISAPPQSKSQAATPAKQQAMPIATDTPKPGEVQKPQKADNPFLHAGLAYAARGILVFPIRPGGKEPLTEHGFKDATTDEAQIREWWAKWPNANIGARTGAASGFVALDIDPGGEESLEALMHQHGTIPETCGVQTGRGKQLCFAHPDVPIRNSAGVLGPGLDIRGDGGYVVAPPSIHPNGKRYAFLNKLGFSPMPEWLIHLVSQAKPPAQPSGAGHGEKIREGQRNSHLTSLAGAMRRQGMSQEAILAALLAENARRCEPPLPESEVRAIAASVSRYKPADQESAASKLVHLSEGMELFHDTMRESYATIQVDTHRETMRIASRSFRQHLSREYFRSEGKAPTPQAFGSALLTIEAKAIFEGPEFEVHTRVAEEDQAIYLDLCNRSWQAVKITGRGWGVVSNPSVKFVRGVGMMPLPMPVEGGSFRELERFTTLRGDDLALFKGAMLGTLRERGPFPILALTGEQGCGKTTLSRLFKRTIDPSRAATRCLPKDERDLMIAAEGQHILALDNLSHIDEQMSDALCRLATGGGLSTRTLYTDRDETVFECERPIILNAITDVLSRPDLIDRSVIVTVPPLEESKRRPEREFWRDFDKVHPQILGALCAAACMALGETKSLPVPTVRMADFCLFVSRGEKGLGLRSKAFLTAYESNRRDVNEVAVDLSPVAQSLKKFLEGKAEWSGTAAELLQELATGTSDDVRRSREWPKTPRGLSGAVRRIIPNLRGVGVNVRVDSREPGTGRRLIKIKCAERPSQPSQSPYTVTDELIENEPDRPSRDGCDGRDGRDATPTSVTVNRKGESEWEA